MKIKIFSLLMMLLMGISVNAQSYWETHDPSPDSIMPKVKVSTLGGIYSLSAVCIKKFKVPVIVEMPEAEVVNAEVKK